MERCPACQQGTLRIIAAMTEVSVIRKILRHLKLAVDSSATHRAGAPSSLCVGHLQPVTCNVLFGPTCARSCALSLPLVPPFPCVCIPSSVWIGPPCSLAAGYILGSLGLLSALPKAQPIEIMPLTFCEERRSSPSAPLLAALPPAARAAAPPAPAAELLPAAARKNRV